MDKILAFHGTSERGAVSICEHGFRPCDPLAMVQLVAAHLQFDPAVLWDSVELQFARARTDLDHAFFTMDRRIAQEYRIPEVIQDAFRAAYRLRVGGYGPARDQWIAQEAERLLGVGRVLEVVLPWDLVGAHAFGRVVSFAEWQEDPYDLHSFSIPVAKLRGELEVGCAQIVSRAPSN